MAVTRRRCAGRTVLFVTHDPAELEAWALELSCPRRAGKGHNKSRKEKKWMPEGASYFFMTRQQLKNWSTSHRIFSPSI